MIKCVAFDIDGVLVDTKPLHQTAFLQALNSHGFPVTEEHHRKHLDGLPTKVKMELLNIPETIRSSIFDTKQDITFDRIESYIKPEKRLQEIFFEIKERNIKIAICSNAIRRFCELTVSCLKLEKYVDLLISNEDSKAKPDPEMYLMVQKNFRCRPDDLLVCEDSLFGLQAAYSSGACVCYIQEPYFLIWKKLESYLTIL